MNLRLLRSTLCLLSVSALTTVSAFAQTGSMSDTWNARAKFADDYNARKYRAVIADAVVLQKLHSMNEDDAQIVAQAYYLSGDKPGCAKYIKENLNPSWHPMAARLLKACEKSRPQP
jgi:hypothetical protein